MIKKTVTYKNLFTDEDVSKDLYFHLDAAELTKLAMTEGQDWGERLENLSKKQDGKTIIEEFEKMLGAAYGERKDDEIIKSPEITERFLRSQAYNALFMELITSTGSGAEFFSALVPADLEKYAEQLKDNPALSSASSATDPTDKRPAWIREDRDPTDKELQTMTKAQMVEVMARRSRKSE